MGIGVETGVVLARVERTGERESPPKVVSLEFVGVNDLVRGGGAMDFLDDGENMEEDEVPTNPTCKDFFPFTSHYPFSFSTSA